MKSSLEPAFDARRTLYATALFGCAFLVLIGKLYVLQIARGEEYVAKSESNFVQERRVAHARGIIFDQAGRVLVDNRSSHDVYMTVAFLPDSNKSLRVLTAPLGLTRPEIDELDKRVLGAVEDTGPDFVTIRDNIDDKACQDIDGIIARDDVRGARLDWAPGEESCRLVVEARSFPSRAAVFRRVRELVGLDAPAMRDHVDKALAKSRGLGRFKATLLLEDVGFEAYARIEAAASLAELPGIDVIDSQKRRYREKNRAAHLLGYMNELSASELVKRKDEGYRLGDLVGRRGVEATYEAKLRGEDGVERVVVDAKGRAKGDRWAEDLLGASRRTPPRAGKALVLSIDDEMQRAAEEAFGGVAGSVVALEVKTGFVLALASFPSYDPNLVTGPWSGEVKRALNLDPNRPWINKAIQDHYAPGSTFKAITATAALRNKLVDQESQRACPGFFRLGRATWRCFNRGGHGRIALVKALQYSCDSYFYSLGYELGPDRLAETARLFGFGKRTGIDIDAEGAGIMPDRAYYVKRFGAYTPGLVVNNAIGQGDVAVTPLQLAVSYAALANGGHIMKPQVVREERNAAGGLEQAHAPIVIGELGVSEKLLETMNEALAHVTDPGGTASGLMWRKERPETSKWLRESGIKLVGKTGTAQVVRLLKSVQHVDAKDVAYEQRDHAWFVAFAPQNDPEIVVVTMTEHGGFGGSVSGPVTAEVIRTWFEKVRPEGRYKDAYGPLPPPKPFVWKPPTPKEAAAPNEETEPHPEPEEPEAAIDVPVPAPAGGTNVPP